MGAGLRVPGRECPSLRAAGLWESGDVAACPALSMSGSPLLSACAAPGVDFLVIEVAGRQSVQLSVQPVHDFDHWEAAVVVGLRRGRFR
ncbi:hypothetical protein ACFPIJ_35510 [Dactylosporangium cerinum]|uniref:Uncharacterized protein n=1 Tax=Dactylosporangium cerinum TaxID=1434730 RepID=A0ABV9W496_9ACTN